MHDYDLDADERHQRDVGGDQRRMLRVLESREVTRVGGGQPFRVNVRVVAATNRPLREQERFDRTSRALKLPGEHVWIELVAEGLALPESLGAFPESL